ncbi:ribosome silencing factor [Salaquimonas pukyongi]|uniref:ribosome silencing factor n=1 Tax=Salaquimonas pukyongi TaxID=2712698 RepID=UPI00096B8B5B|nr:ribosome silencing factor [Salaquimonas pukyongi]
MHAGAAVENAAPSASEAADYSVEDVLNAVTASLEDSKAENITTIDIRKKSALGDYMLVASGRSHRHVAAICDHLLRAIKDSGYGPARVEGLQAADWVLIDTGDVIVHVFRPEVREFYGIEKMWTMPETGGRH